MNWTLYVSGLPKVICNQCLRKIYAPYGTVQAPHGDPADHPASNRPRGCSIGVPAEVCNAVAALKQGQLAGYTIEAYVSDHTQ